jgi:hypothetical protein
MTYNFDPERWFERELAALEARRSRGELDDPGFQAALEELQARYEDLLRRTDIRHDYS